MGKYIVTLEKEEQEKLKEVIAKRSSKSEIVKRAFVLLNLDENGEDQKKSDEQIRLDYKVGQRTVERLRKRFVEDGFETALKGKPQMKFREKKIDGRVEAKLLALRCSDAPAGSQKWSLRSLAETLIADGAIESISHESVRQTLKKMS
ncbi:MAG: helix-turn-helix domain-containing protein [Acidobacteriota bacterium]|nr:helix-turn-helix domain-containing protein [Acidobacteriota bacterium]